MTTALLNISESDKAEDSGPAQSRLLDPGTLDFRSSKGVKRSELLARPDQIEETRYGLVDQPISLSAAFSIPARRIRTLRIAQECRPRGGQTRRYRRCGCLFVAGSFRRVLSDSPVRMGARSELVRAWRRMGCAGTPNRTA